MVISMFRTELASTLTILTWLVATGEGTLICNPLTFASRAGLKLTVAFIAISVAHLHPS